MLEAIKEAVKFPFQSENWIKKIVIGYVITVASLLIIPAPLLIGYMVRVMREDQMPDFNNLLSMYVDGLKAIAVVLIYLIPGVLIGLAGQGQEIVTAIGFAAFIIGWWSIESGIYQLANQGFKQAFTKSAIRQAFTLNYLIGILASIILPIIVFIIYGLSLLLVLTVLLFPAVQFYTMVLRYRVIRNAIEL